MTEGIKEIYEKNIGLIKQTEWMLRYFRIQNLDAAFRKSVFVLNTLMEMLPKYIQEENYFNEDKIRYTQESLVNICQLLLEAQEGKDYILLADYYELYLLPLLYDLQEKIGISENGVPVDFEAEKYSGFQVEYTGCGAVTLRQMGENKTRYLHSNKSPYKEAMELALSWYSEEKEEYIIYGLGLGYHIQALSELDSSISISVYESNEKVVELFRKFGTVSIESNPNIQIYYDKDLEMLIKKINIMREGAELVVHEPSMDLLPSSERKEWLEEYFLEYSSIKNQLKFLNSNFRKNTKKVAGCIDELREEFSGKTIYLVGAGPSLDKNFLELKNVSEDSIILSTGTAFRKLMSSGIRPDFVMETDPNERVKKHFRNMESETVPLLLLSTATHELVKAYAGKKYLFFQKDYKKAEEVAKEKSYTVYETGGSVMTAALDVAIKMKCKRIVFLGLDLAYTDNFAHALGTSRREIPKESIGMKQVEDIYGNMILVNKPFDMFRKWIEKRIEKSKHLDIQFIDATEGGVKIARTEIKRLKEVLE